MATMNQTIIGYIQSIADDCGVPEIQASFGTPGTTVKIKALSGSAKSTEIELETGSAWYPAPTAFTVLVRGFTKFFGDMALQNLKSKLNELIDQYNQLRDDYVAGIPTTATKVYPLK